MPLLAIHFALAPLAVVLCACLALCGCASVDVRLADFMSPDRPPRSAALPHGYAVHDLVIHRGSRLIGLTHAYHPDSRSVVVFCGGDRFHRSINGGEALESLALGADVVLFDYPGYGESTGTPTPATVLETALAVYDYADALQTSAGKKRVVYGFSLGGLVAAHVARDRAADGVVLEATAANAASWARSQIPWLVQPLVTPRVEPGLAAVDAVETLMRFRGTVLVLAGTTDRQAPATLSKRLDRELRKAGVRVQLMQFARARHGEISHAPQFAATLRAFLDELQE
jgi:uncharacterized protein